MNKGPSKTTWILMGVSAFFFDFLQWITSAVTLIPFVGQIIGPALGIVISIFAWMTLGLWMKMYDVNILNKSTAIMSIFELIPLLNSLPTFTAIVVKRYLDIKAENALNNPVSKISVQKKT